MKKILRSILKAFSEAGRFLYWLIFYIKNPKTGPYDNKGKHLVIMGNGPSAGSFPYDKYKDAGYDFCCVNYFALDEARFFSLKPAFYCMVDPAFADPTVQKTEKCSKLIANLERVDWDMKLICYKDAHLSVQNPHITYQFVNHNIYDGELTGFKKYLYDRNMATCGFQNVMIAVLYYFILSRAEHILMTGVENNWHRELIVGEDNNVYRQDTHFYGSELINVTASGAIKKGELYAYFGFYATTLRQYAQMAVFAAKNNVRVENTCLDSFVDVFPKIPA